MKAYCHDRSIYGGVQFSISVTQWYGGVHLTNQHLYGGVHLINQQLKHIHYHGGVQLRLNMKTQYYDG